MPLFFYVVSYCHLSATLQTMNIIVETYKKIELWFEILSLFLGLHVTLPLRLICHIEECFKSL